MLTGLPLQLDDETQRVRQLSLALEAKARVMQERDAALSVRESAVVASSSKAQARMALAEASERALAAAKARRTDEAGQCARALAESKAALAEALASKPQSTFSGHAHEPRALAPSLVAAKTPVKPFPIGAVEPPPFLETLVEKTLFFRNTSQLNLMPKPAHVEWEGGWMPFRDVQAEWTLADDPHAAAGAAVARLLARLSKLATAVDSAAPRTDTVVNLRITVQCQNATFDLEPRLGVDESYSITTKSDGVVAVEAVSATGVLRAFVTVAQMAGGDAAKGVRLFPARCRIADQPDLPWRGVHLDVSRNWHPAENVLSLLDNMEWAKFNVLHFHLCDDQGFRVESKVFPKLHEKASEGEYFTQAQMRELIKAAAFRGIRVMPEFDMPGHAGSFLLAYPELAAPGAPVPKALPKAWGVHPFVLDATSERMYGWVEKFLGEMVALFPDAYYHIGGDEVPAEAWREPAVVAWMHNHSMHASHELQLHFNARINAMLAKHGRHMVGWDEVLTRALPKDVVVHLWRTWAGDLAEQADTQGLRTITSQELYLGEQHRFIFLFVLLIFFPDWARPVKHYYHQDVVGRSRSRLGAEACMWSEWASHNVDNRMWPTLLAVAERMWRASVPPAQSQSMYARLLAADHALTASGSHHTAVYAVAIRALLTGLPYTYTDVMTEAREPQEPSAVHVVVRRLTDALQPVNRVGGGAKHALVELMDVLRPDSLEMRALALLLDQVVQRDRFADAHRVGLVRSYLAQYAELGAQWKRHVQPRNATLLAGVEPLVHNIAEVAAGAVQLIDHLAKGHTKAAGQEAQRLLSKIAGVEDARLGTNKVLVEFAHVLETALAQPVKTMLAA